MMANGRYLMTHSLLSSWLYAMRNNPYEDAETERDPMEDFMLTLRRMQTPTTEAMQKGLDFEKLCYDIALGQFQPEFDENGITPPLLNGEYGEEPRGHYVYPPYYNAAHKVAQLIKDGSFQHKAKKEINVGGVKYLLYGRLDALKAGVIYDIKFSSHYERGKFEASTQHPVYMELLPEARTFTYLISNGRDVWRETYRRDETRSVYPIIADFAAWLEARELTETYHKHWAAL